MAQERSPTPPWRNNEPKRQPRSWIDDDGFEWYREDHPSLHERRQEETRQTRHRSRSDSDRSRSEDVVYGPRRDEYEIEEDLQGRNRTRTERPFNVFRPTKVPKAFAHLRGAGIIAIGGSARDDTSCLVCVVENRKHKLSFPKGGLRPDLGEDRIFGIQSFRRAARREWEEETGLSAPPLGELQYNPALYDNTGTLYFYAFVHDDVHPEEYDSSWSVQDRDPDLLSAMWIDVEWLYKQNAMHSHRKHLLRTVVANWRSTA